MYGVPEKPGETVDECVQKCVDVFSTRLGVPVTKADIEIAHRSGKPGGARPRPILARFLSRRLRSSVLASRRKLKQTGISIGEDLTSLNYKLLKKTQITTASLTAWSSNGKILAKLKNGQTVRIEVSTDIDKAFARVMK